MRTARDAADSREEAPERWERFEVPGFTGCVLSRYRLPGEAFAHELLRLTDAAAAVKTLHWGRNYLYLARLASPEGPVEVVVKQFRRTGMRDRLRRQSKAARSFATARALLAAGFATPEPVLLAETTDSHGPSFYICRHLAPAIEARYLFRAANASALAAQFPAVDFPAFVETLGATVRRLHDAGFWHRDLSGGNLLLPADQAGAPRDLYLLDLNRTRRRRRLTLSQRCRDLCRLALFRPEDQDRLLTAYWGKGEVGALRRGLYLLYHRSFLWKNRVKPALRRLAARLRNLGPSRAPHAHIPPPPAGAAGRDRVVWDALSDQPHQHAGRLTRLGIRLADARAHAEEAVAVARALPRIGARYRMLRGTLRAELQTRPVPWGGVGVAVRPHPEAPEVVPQALAELGRGAAPLPVLLRLHPWEVDHRAEEELARELASQGHELTFALPQNRELVRDPARWRAAVEEIGERFSPYGRRFEIGHAINRSKWGIWNLGQYVELATAAMEILRRQGDVLILGPAVIDFELHVSAAVLNLKRPGLRFDAVSSLLYVDRRGAPENRQAGFDTVAKVVLARAIADTARNAAGRVWITEVNWPLAEGPYSPAGRAVAVDEETQADYLARYYLLTLGTGLVERVFWWQLIAKGYGLMDPEDPRRPRRRPSFHALKTLVRELDGTTLERVLPAPEPARLYLFRRPDGMAVVAGWSAGGPVSAMLPSPPAGVCSREGEALTLPAGPRVEVSSAVRYLTLLD
jgi:lipopolysaccharide kinase (Kdo/WaaP) family protein